MYVSRHTSSVSPARSLCARRSQLRASPRDPFLGPFNFGGWFAQQTVPAAIVMTEMARGVKLPVSGSPRRWPARPESPASETPH